jgi:hypothetical protein
VDSVFKPNYLGEQIQIRRVAGANSSIHAALKHSPQKMPHIGDGINSGAIGRLSGAHYEYGARKKQCCYP